MHSKSMWTRRVVGLLLASLIGVSQVGCGGGGGGSGSGSTQVVAGPDTKIISGQDAAAQLSQVSASTTDNSTTLQFNAGSAYGNALQAGDVVQVLPGSDVRFPLGFAGKVNAVSASTDGSKLITTGPVRAGEVFSAVQSTQSEVALNAGNLVAIIMPKAVSATMGAGGKIPTNVILSAADRTRMSKLSASRLATTDLGQLAPLNFSIPIIDAGADATKTRPVGGRSDVKISGSIAPKNLKFSHDYQSEGGVPTKVSGTLSGDWVFDVAMVGSAEFSLGFANAAWKEVEDEHFKLLGFSAKATGLDSADKVGKIPLAAFVWVPEVPATVTPFSFGKTQTPIRAAKMAGVVVWVYINAKGTITVGDASGADTTVDFFKSGTTNISLGANYERGKSLELISDVKKSPEAEYAYEAPHISGKLSAGAKVGASLDTDFFIGGIRFANASAFVGGEIEGAVQGEGGLTAATWQSNLQPSGLFCYGWTGGYGAILSADVNVDVDLETPWSKSSVGSGYSYSTQVPDETSKGKVGWHSLWYTIDAGDPVCKNSFVVPLVAKIERQNLFSPALYDVRVDFSEALKDPVLLAQKGQWQLKIGGATTEVIDLDPAAGGSLTKSLPAGTYSLVVEVLHPDLKSAAGMPAHIKDSNVVSVAIPGIAVRAEPFLVSVGNAVMLWVENAWDTVAQVVWNFGVGVVEQTALVINGVSTQISQAFASVGDKTVTTVFKDLFGVVVGSSSVTVSVNSLVPEQTAVIVEVIDDVAPQTGVLAQAAQTDDTAPTLNGTISAALNIGQKLNVYDGNVLFEAVAVVSGTTWSFTPAAPLSHGVHSFTVEVAGVDGTPGPRSAPYAITIDSSSVSAVTPGEIIRTLTGSFDIAGRDLPTSGLSVTVPGDSKASCQSPNNMTAAGFGVACTFYQLGAQTLEVRTGSKLIGSVRVTVKSNVTGVTWTSPSTTSSGTVKFGETVTFKVAGVNLLADPVMGFAVQLCGVSNAEAGAGSDTQRTFTCNFNNGAGAVAGQMPGVVKDAPGGQVLFDGWNVPVEVPAAAGTIDLPATSFVRGENVALIANGGGLDALGNAPPYLSAPNAAEWDFTVATAGTYELFAEYAAALSRPVVISFNGAVKFNSALSAVTGGWFPADRQVISQGTVQLAAGATTMRVARGDVFPHIKGFRLVPMPAVVAGLVGHWSFDNCDGSDSSGLARTATLVNTTCVAGRRGQALEFRNPGTNTFGGSDWVELPPHPAAAVTFNAWVKWAGDNSGTGGFAGALWSLGTHTVTPYASLWVNEWTGKVWTDWYTNSPNQLVPGVWTMLTLVADGQSESLYINGELVNTSPRSGQASFQGLRQFIARHYWGDGDNNAARFRGVVDEVRMYGRTLTAAEVRVLYAQ